MNRYLVKTLEEVTEFTLGTVENLFHPGQFRPLTETEFSAYPSDLQSFYAAPPGAPEMAIIPVHSGRDGSRRLRFSFPSPIASPYPENNIAYGLADLRPPGMARGALIFLHGHKMTGLGPLEWFTRLSIRAGYDVYYLVGPYHMLRRPKGSYNGQYSVSADLGRTLQAFQQGVVETRLLISWIKSQQELPVALAGISLGGYVAALAACVDGRIAALAPMVTGASFARLVWEDYSLRYVRGELLKAGVGPQELEEIWALTAPGRWRPLLQPERILLMAGQHDPAVLPSNTLDLWRAWGQPGLRWYPCGHTTMFFYAGSMGRDLAEFLLHSDHSPVPTIDQADTRAGKKSLPKIRSA